MHIKNLFIFLLVLLTGTVAIAEEKIEQQPIRAGEIARFDGYLFSPEAIAKVINKTDKELKLAKLECQNKLELANIDLQKVNDLSSMENKLQTKLLQDTVKVKDEIIDEKLKRIDHLEKRVNYSGYLIAGSFLAGSLTAFAIIHYTIGIVK